jgi:hypothetical protein
MPHGPIDQVNRFPFVAPWSHEQVMRMEGERTQEYMYGVLETGLRVSHPCTVNPLGYAAPAC